MYDEAGGEIESTIGYLKDEGDMEGVRELSHLQGALFDNDEVESANRKSLMKKRIVTSGRGKLGKVHERVGEISTIPTSHLQPRDPLDIAFRASRATKGSEIVPRPETRLVSKAGRYNPEKVGSTPSGELTPDGRKKYKRVITESDTVSVDATNSFNPVGVLVHEMGHRQHISSFPRSAPESTGLARESGADALLEAHADAYVDRYLQSNVEAQPAYQQRYPDRSRWKALERTGYSTNFKGDRLRGTQWEAADAALYAAARAHVGATGELVPYKEARPSNLERDTTGQHLTVSKREASVDATLHHLLSTSQPAKQALRQTSQTQIDGKKQTTVALKGVGAEAFRRHRDRQLLRQGQEVQHPLWEDHSLSHNQFGETPRTVADVSETLKIPEARLHSRGLL
jgi:hypothetical protein